MAGGFPLVVNGIEIRTAEALYQAMRFALHAAVQWTIIAQPSPIGAKMSGKPWRQTCSRPDWDGVRVDVMRWVLRVKLAHHPDRFGSLLAATGTRPIVEDLGTRRATVDAMFWGARPVSGCQMLGTNMMGKLLEELRDQVRVHGIRGFRTVAPLNIPDFKLYDRDIEAVQP